MVIVDTKQAQAERLASVVGIPLALAVGIGAPDLVGARVLSDVPIAKENERLARGATKVRL